MKTYKVHETKGNIVLTETEADSLERILVRLSDDETEGEIILVKDDSEMKPFKTKGTPLAVQRRIRRYLKHSLFKIQDRPATGEEHEVQVQDSRRKNKPKPSDNG